MLSRTAFFHASGLREGLQLNIIDGVLATSADAPSEEPAALASTGATTANRGHCRAVDALHSYGLCDSEAIGLPTVHDASARRVNAIGHQDFVTSHGHINGVLVVGLALLTST